MDAEARSERMVAVAAHPLAELLLCPPETGILLNASAQCIHFDSGDLVFRQASGCQGLYLVVSGLFVRRAERLESRFTLAPARPGDLVARFGGDVSNFVPPDVATALEKAFPQ